MNKIRLTESDLKYMIRRAVNEVMAYEEKPAHDKYYFGDGWEKRKDPSYKLSAEGPVGEGYDEYLADLTQFIEGVISKNQKGIFRDIYMKIRVEMPNGDKDPFWGDSGWRRYANTKCKGETIPIDPENIEEAAKKAWDIFNEYASRTPEVVGWHLWSWSTFEPTLKPILNPEAGTEISDEGQRISDFYSSLKYKGD